jgi:hypothetical protein
MVDVSTPGRSRQASLAALPALQPGVLEWVAASVAMVLVLLAPALWNGFPLIFPDTGGYLARPFEGTLIIGRSALYGLFLYAGVPAAFWSNAFLQAALTAWLIVLTMRAQGLGGRPWLAVGIVAMLSVATSLPWFAGQLMPDILFPAAVLSLALLVFQAAHLNAWERGVLAAVIAFAIPSHMAAAGLCIALLAALWLTARLMRNALPKPTLTLPAVAVAAGIALCPISNFAITGSFAFTPGGESFLFGRLIEDGIVKRYLNERCPDARLRLCAYKSKLPDEADNWLWGDSPFYTLGGWTGYAAEERAIIADTLARYPLLHAKTAIVAVLKQFAAFQTEISLTDNEPTIAILSELTPQLINQLMSARQQSGHFDVAPLNLLHVPAGALAIAALALAVLARQRLRLAPELVALCLTVLLALAANAAICGAFSHPVDRYQSRLVPLAPFAVALLIARRQSTPT